MEKTNMIPAQDATYQLFPTGPYPTDGFHYSNAFLNTSSKSSSQKSENIDSKQKVSDGQIDKNQEGDKKIKL